MAKEQRPDIRRTYAYKKRDVCQEDVNTLRAHLDEAIANEYPDVIIRHRKSLLRRALKGHKPPAQRVF
jgi:hypothetical protein